MAVVIIIVSCNCRYLRAYASFWLSFSASRMLPQELTMIDEYSAVSYMRMTVTLQVRIYDK